MLDSNMQVWQMEINKITWKQTQKWLNGNINGKSHCRISLKDIKGVNMYQARDEDKWHDRSDKTAEIETISYFFLLAICPK